MADNTLLDTGLSSTCNVADDEVDGAKFQRIKIDLGADGASSPLVRGQQTSANSIPVVLASDQSVTITADTEIPAAAVLADNTANPTTPSIGVFPHWFDGTTWDRALGNSTDGALVNLGTNNDVTVTGTVTANLAAGTNNIGDVDVLSIAAGDNNIGNVDIVTVPAPLSTTGGGTEATALRVTLATDSTGVVSVDDNGSSLTVDGTVAVSSVGGTVAVTQSGSWDEVGINDSGNSITVDNGGTFAVQVDGAALTALQLIDNPVSVLGTATYSEATSSGFIVGAVRRDADTSAVNTDNEIAPLIVDANGYLKVEIFDGGGSHTVDNGGTFVVQENGSALTALQLIDDAIFVDDTATHSTGSTKIMGVGGVAVPTDTAISANDIGMFAMSLNRGLHVEAQAGENFIGSVGGRSNVYEVTLSTDTAAYASGDLIADTQQLDAFFRKTDGTGVINDITIIDEEAQGVAFYLYFMKTSTSFGSENSAPNISDANLSAGLIGIVPIATTDWVTLSGCSVCCIKNIGLVVEAVSGTDDLYIAAVNSTGTPDWDADSLKVKIGTLLD